MNNLRTSDKWYQTSESQNCYKYGPTHLSLLSALEHPTNNIHKFQSSHQLKHKYKELLSSTQRYAYFYKLVLFNTINISFSLIVVSYSVALVTSNWVSLSIYLTRQTIFLTYILEKLRSFPLLYLWVNPSLVSTRNYQLFPYRTKEKKTWRVFQLKFTLEFN